MTSPELQPEQVRCTCGRLMARRTARGYELKCVRCKSIWSLPLNVTGKFELLSPGAQATGESHEA